MKTTTTTNTNVTLQQVTALVNAFNAISVEDVKKAPEKAAAYTAMTAAVKELNAIETTKFYDDNAAVNASAVDYFKQQITLTALALEKNDTGTVCKAEISSRMIFVDPFEVAKRTGITESTDIIKYGAKYFALLQCKNLGISPEKSKDLIGKRFTSVYIGKNAPEITSENISTSKVCKCCLQPIFDLFKVELNANNIDVKFIDIGMAKHSNKPGEVIISNTKTYSKLIAEVIYCRLNNIRYSIA